MTSRISLLAMLVALPFIATTTVQAAQSEAATSAASQLAKTANGKVTIERHALSGNPSFVRSARNGDLMPTGKATDKSIRFLRSNAALFGLSNADRDLRLLSSKYDKTGQRSDKYQQMHKGVPVFGTRLVSAIDRNGKLKSVNGATAPELNVNVIPNIASSSAAATAISHISNKLAPRDLGNLESNANTLYVYSENFVRGRVGQHELVWEIEVVGNSTREFVYVNAHHGKVVDQITGTYDALNRNIYDGGFGAGNLVWSEGQATPTGTTAWDELIAYSEDTYNLISSMTQGSFLSWNGTDGIMNAVNNDPAINCPNAQFTGSYIRFCDGTTTDDVVAHEWVHGYTQETHNLIYQDQSGALNEAYSDIFGEIVDFLNGAGTDTPITQRTLGGCSVFGGAAPPTMDVNAPSSIAGSYVVAGAGFNPAGAPTVTDNLAIASPIDACGPIAGNVAGSIAVIDRGTCSFVDKVTNAAAAGATGAIVVNNVAGAPFSMGGAGSPGIPAVMVSMADGDIIKGETGVNATISLSASTQNSYRWLVGEDSAAFGGSIRDMWNPSCFGDPDKVSSSLYACDPDGLDSGGVHSNSGIINHGFALLVDGGDANGESISAIGITKAAHIYWRTMLIYQTPTSGYADHANALLASCNDLIGLGLATLSTNQAITGIGSDVISAADCAQVAKLEAALELDQQPVQCNFQSLLAQDPPQKCAAGESPVVVFSDDFESGLGAWTVGTRAVVNAATFDVPQWSVASNPPLSSTGQAAYGADPIIGNCTSDIEAGINYLQSPVITLPASALLSFDHSVATEQDWDGGNIKVSVNGGTFTLLPNTAFIYNGYTGPLNAGDNPMANEPAWHGSDGGSFNSVWGESQIDLSSIANAGDQIEIRFELGTDGCNGNDGWYVDNVQAFSCEVSVIDSDNDGVSDDLDNCTDVANPSQLDSNGDGFGNMCDQDTDNNCVINFVDVSAFAAAFQTSDADNDFNGDGFVNFLDYSLLTSRIFGAPGPSGLAVCP